MKPVIDYTLYLVTDRELARDRDVLALIGEAVAGGVTVVQLREKRLESRAFLDAAIEAKRVLDAHALPLIINDRVDIVLACGATGVHLGQEDLPCEQARRLVGDDVIIGVSVSTPEQAQAAEAAGADYLGVSPVYATPTKTNAPGPTGLDGLAAIRRATRLPLVGIGGLNPENVAAVIQSGADGIAVVSAIVAAASPRRAAAALRECIQRSRSGA